MADGAKPIKADFSERPLLHGARWSALWIIFNQITKVVRGLVIPRLLEPSLYGMWASLSLVLGYAQYADLGVNQQMGKRLPYRLGQEGEAGFRDLAQQGTGWGLMTSGLAAVVLFLWSFWYSGPNPGFYKVALGLVGLSVIAQKLRVMGSTLLGSRFLFRQAAIGGMLVDGVGLVLAVLFLLQWGVMGLVWAFLATEFLVAAYYFSRIGFPLPTFVPAQTLPMVSEGFLLLAVTLIEQALMTVDQVYLVSFFPREQYGIYALGLFLTSALLSASGVFLTVTQPKVMHLAGEGKLDEARTVVRASLLLYLVILALLVGMAVFGMDLAVSYYLPKYQAGLHVFVLMPLMALVRGPVILLRPLFLARNQEKFLIAIELVGLGAAAVLDTLVVIYRPSLILIAMASILGYGLVAACMAWSVHAFSRVSEAGSNRFTLFLSMSSMAGVAGLFAFYGARSSASVGIAHYVGEGFLAGTVYTTWVGLFVWAGRRHWQQAWRIFRHGSAVPAPQLAFTEPL